MDPNQAPRSAGANYHGNDFAGDSMGFPAGAYDQTVPGQLSASCDPHVRFSDAEEAGRPSDTAHAAKKAQRKRQPHGPDHIKHRRTRSGCYTCRQRRVKVRGLSRAVVFWNPIRRLI